MVSGAECFGQGGAARRDAAAARPVAAAGARGDAGGSGVALSSVEEPCPRPAVGAVVEQPEDLRSKDGVLRVELVVRSHREADGTRAVLLRVGGWEAVADVARGAGGLVGFEFEE